MFGFFKKKNTALDILIESVYGKNPPKPSANLNEAIVLAYKNLLDEYISLSEVSTQAKQLNSSGIPYNTYDLALCTALNFFRKAESKADLFQVQLQARTVLMQWVLGEKCHPKIAEMFENTLYCEFKDLNNNFSKGDQYSAENDEQKKLEAKSLINIIERKSFSNDGYFFDIHQDIELYFSKSRQATVDILMPILYARRFCFAGMYAQGLTSKKNFDEIDQNFFMNMAQIGQNISKEEQVEFQEESFKLAMEWINHEYCKIEINTSKLLLVAAKNGLSLRDALKSAIDTWEEDNFSKNLNLKTLKPEFCIMFYTMGEWLPNNGYDELARKCYDFLYHSELKPYKLLFENDMDLYLNLEAVERVNNPELFKQIQKDGVDYAAKKFAHVLGQQIRSKTVAYKFILQELDGMIQGDEIAVNFATTCGISISEFKGCLEIEDNEVEALQFFLNQIGFGLYPRMDISSKLRVKIIMNIMEEYKFGKYQHEI